MTAVRHIASSYPYTSRREGELSLRDNADEITGKLSAEIAARIAAAGVRIIESRLTQLSYAPEIAQARLRSTNAQIEFLLRRALADAGRLPGAPGQCGPAGGHPPQPHPNQPAVRR